jgi:hypothetical protein
MRRYRISRMQTTRISLPSRFTAPTRAPNVDFVFRLQPPRYGFPRCSDCTSTPKKPCHPERSAFLHPQKPCHPEQNRLLTPPPKLCHPERSRRTCGCFANAPGCQFIRLYRISRMQYNSDFAPILLYGTYPRPKRRVWIPTSAAEVRVFPRGSDFTYKTRQLHRQKIASCDAQLLLGVSTASTTYTSALAFFASSFSPSCSLTAVKSSGLSFKAARG